MFKYFFNDINKILNIEWKVDNIYLNILGNVIICICFLCININLLLYLLK